MSQENTSKQYVVDTRPLALVLLSRLNRPLRLLLGVGLFVLVYSMETPEGLSEEGRKAMAVFALCLTWWVLNVLPLMITSLMAIALIPLTGIMPAEQAYSLFGNSAVFFIMGAFILAACLMKSGLSTRLGLLFLQRFGHSPRSLLCAVFLMNAFMAFWMSEHAVAAMNFPIVMEIVMVLKLRQRRSSYAKALFLALAWGSTIGGVATLLGGGRAPLALGILEQYEGTNPFTFLDWTLRALPVVVVMLGVGWLVITRFFPIDQDSVADAETALAEKVAKLGPMSRDEKAIGAVMLGTVATWVLAGHDLGLANVAIGAIVLLFVFKLVKWRDVEEYVNWGIILMYGGAICLGAALNDSGAATWLAHRTLGLMADSPTSAVAALSASSWLLTEAISNSAVVALMMPMGLGMADTIGLVPATIAPLIAIPAGLAFAFPIGTPANAIAYSSGFLRLRDIILPGAIMGATGWVVFNLTVRFYWTWAGYIHL
jgi:sodium-dependent dicarboxylate transporter 2/3/5